MCEISLNLSVTDGLANGASAIVKKDQVASTNSRHLGTLWILFEEIIIDRNTRKHKQYSEHMCEQVLFTMDTDLSSLHTILSWQN